MNYINKVFKIKKGKVKVKKENGNLIVENNSNSKGLIVFGRPFITKGDNIKILYRYDILSGGNCELKLLNKKFKVVETINNDSEVIFNKINRCLFFGLSISPNTIVRIKNIEGLEEYKIVEENNNDDILLITPGYPSYSNKYSYAFVHTRVLEYKKKGWNVDVKVVNDNFIEKTSYYTFEGVNVVQTGFNEIRLLLQTKKYKKIFIHFFSEQYVQLLDASNIYDTDIFIFTHGSDILYRDINLLTNEYFKKVKKPTKQQEEFFLLKDKMVNRYNQMPNVKFVFASNWAKERAEEENNIKFKNYVIMPTFIDENVFKYSDKDEELRKKITIIRKYDNLSTYSIDVAVKTILELSKRKCFKELEFNIYGDGEYHDKLLKPIKDFENVHIYKKFLTHSEIAEVHKENGIALFATRYETQGVSAAEAAMSGLVVISNSVAAVPEMFDKKFKVLAKNEDYKEMANIIERIYNNPNEFKKLSKAMHDNVLKKYGYDATMKKELKVLEEKQGRYEFKFGKITDNKVLTIAIAAYNVEKYLYNSVFSLISSPLAHKLEILIVNDGSKDNTSEIGKKLEELTTINGKSIVKFIDKENGGHGSTINKGIELATGKYFKMMDGDDYFDTESLTKLIEYLEESDEDMILNNYVEDLSVPCILNPIRHYEFMKPGKTYNIENLCKDDDGFKEWGPLLSTSTYKTSILKDANFKISEHCFYVDMELNSIAFSKTKTIKYYPLDLYIYYLGRVGQSVSQESFKRNYKNHEHVTLRIISDIYYKEKLSPIKKEYLKSKIILPLVKGQYYITTEYFNTGQQFMEFDSKLKEYPEFYNDNSVIDKRVKIYRKTNGHFIKTVKRMVRIKQKIFRRKG